MIRCVDLKKNSQPKSWELYLIHWEFLGFQSWEKAFQIKLRDLLGGAEGSLTTKCSYIKRLLLTNENQISQVKEFSTFQYMGRCKILGLLKLFLWYVPQLSGSNTLYFHFSGFLRAHSLPQSLPAVSDCSLVASQFSSVQSLSHVRLFATPWTAALQASLSITNSQYFFFTKSPHGSPAH